MTEPERVDLTHLNVAGDGVHWSLGASDDLNANLVHLDPGHAIGEHVNSEVDVLVVVLAGSGTAVVAGDDLALAQHVVAHIPRGTERRIEAGPDGVSYLTVHRRRGPLRIGSARKG